jgi:hypothetical protein
VRASSSSSSSSSSQGITPRQLQHVDLYTCFPIAAQAAAREFGLEARPRAAHAPSPPICLSGAPPRRHHGLSTPSVALPCPGDSCARSQSWWLGPWSVQAVDDGRRMTLTGGLMYNGGPGANTAMHGLAALVPRLRSQPGSYGLVYANGGMMTKHSVGIYSTRPWASTHSGGAWRRVDPHTTQVRVRIKIMESIIIRTD